MDEIIIFETLLSKQWNWKVQIKAAKNKVDGHTNKCCNRE